MEAGRSCNVGGARELSFLWSGLEWIVVWVQRVVVLMKF